MSAMDRAKDIYSEAKDKITHAKDHTGSESGAAREAQEWDVDSPADVEYSPEEVEYDDSTSTGSFGRT